MAHIILVKNIKIQKTNAKMDCGKNRAKSDTKSKSSEVLPQLIVLSVFFEIKDFKLSPPGKIF
jgi:hypothetical protein